MKAYKLSAGLPPEQPKIGKLKYLVMAFDCNKIKLAKGMMSYDVDRFIGFLNEKCQFIGQFFTGKKEFPHLGKVVQLPHLFNTKKKCNETIRQARKHDKGFGNKHRYEIVLIDVNTPMEEVVKQI